MPTTMQLLDRALNVKRAAHWATELQLSSGTITNARNRGRLSPTLAGNIAIKLGEDPAQWMAIAALEETLNSLEAEALTLTAGEHTNG